MIGPRICSKRRIILTSIIVAALVLLCFHRAIAVATAHQQNAGLAFGLGSLASLGQVQESSISREEIVGGYQNDSSHLAARAPSDEFQQSRDRGSLLSCLMESAELPEAAASEFKDYTALNKFGWQRQPDEEEKTDEDFSPVLGALLQITGMHSLPQQTRWIKANWQHSEDWEDPNSGQEYPVSHHTNTCW